MSKLFLQHRDLNMILEKWWSPYFHINIFGSSYESYIGNHYTKAKPDVEGPRSGNGYIASPEFRRAWVPTGGIEMCLQFGVGSWTYVTLSYANAAKCITSNGCLGGQKKGETEMKRECGYFTWNFHARKGDGCVCDMELWWCSGAPLGNFHISSYHIFSCFPPNSAILLPSRASLSLSLSSAQHCGDFFCEIPSFF